VPLWALAEAYLRETDILPFFIWPPPVRSFEHDSDSMMVMVTCSKLTTSWLWVSVSLLVSDSSKSDLPKRTTQGG
jgi:hypothetical protein